MYRPHTLLRNTDEKPRAAQQCLESIFRKLIACVVVVERSSEGGDTIVESARLIARPNAFLTLHDKAGRLHTLVKQGLKKPKLNASMQAPD